MLLVGSWNENQWICPFGRAVGTNTFWYFVQSAWVFTYTVSIFSCNTVLAWSTSDKFGAELVRLVICLSQEVWLDVSQLVQTWTSNRGSGEPWKFSTNYLRGSWCALFFFSNSSTWADLVVDCWTMFAAVTCRERFLFIRGYVFEDLDDRGMNDMRLVYIVFISIYIYRYNMLDF